MSMERILIVVLCVIIVLLFVKLVIDSIHLKKRKDFDELCSEMDGTDFEFFCADLLKESGFLDVEVTKLSGDYGVDILAEKDGISFAFQCKNYMSPVGIKAVQQIYSGKAYYDKMVGVVMTNHCFTKPAIDFAEKLNILLWDGEYLKEMAEENEVQ